MKAVYTEFDGIVGFVVGVGHATYIIGNNAYRVPVTFAVCHRPLSSNVQPISCQHAVTKHLRRVTRGMILIL